MRPGWGPWLARALVAGMILTILAMVYSATASAQEGKAPAGGDGDQTGTDPRSFSPKFMPYYRYTELENGMEQHDLVAFGLLKLSERAALTYEIPLARQRDIRNTGLHDPDTGECRGKISGGPPDLPGGLTAEGDCEETGLGDMNARFLYKLGSGLGGDWMIGSQFNFPTASDDVLGSEQFQIGPMVTYVRDFNWYPAPGAFGAFMNFYFFDAFGEGSRSNTSFYLGRWFTMFPLTPPNKGPLIWGLYALPEFQPMYDFEDEHFSFWAGFEVGKMMAPGRLLYLKPGFGADPDADQGDRDWTFELGFRWFL